MPELKCTVQTCTHNKQYICDLDAIKVEGASAKNAAGTSCASFEEKKEGSGYSNSMSNSTGTASDCSCVECKATDCKYNEQCSCNAGKISVEGGDASTSAQTECASFICCC